jgi:hypothetical protein
MKYLVILIFLALTGCTGDGDRCDISSKETKMAQNLSQQELENLYKSMKAISDKNISIGPGFDGEMPDAFKYLNPIALQVEKYSHAFLYLKICGMDYKVTMYFLLYSEPGEIKLIWGDGPDAGQMVLWPKT